MFTVAGGILLAIILILAVCVAIAAISSGDSDAITSGLVILALIGGSVWFFA